MGSIDHFVTGDDIKNINYRPGCAFYRDSITTIQSAKKIKSVLPQISRLYCKHSTIDVKEYFKKYDIELVLVNDYPVCMVDEIEKATFTYIDNMSSEYNNSFNSSFPILILFMYLFI